MVNIGTALLGVQDTVLIVLEGVLVSFDTNANWLLGNGSLHLSDRVFLNSLEAGDFNFTGILFLLALTVSSLSRSVWVVLLEINGFLLSKLESIFFETTITSFITVLGA